MPQLAKVATIILWSVVAVVVIVNIVGIFLSTGLKFQPPAQGTAQGSAAPVASTASPNVTTPVTPRAGATAQAVGGTPTATSNAELRVNLPGEPETLDPHLAISPSSIAVVKQVFEGLLRFTPRLGLEAAVAREVPSFANGGISSNGTTYTFKLRNDVKWSDGKPVTARDFEYSIKRMLAPPEGYAYLYYDIRGANDYNLAKQADSMALAKLRDAVGVKATNDTTLVVELTKPRPSFLQLMALPAYPVRQEMGEKGEWNWRNQSSLVGNGPFQVTEWVGQNRIVLEPNPYYYGQKAKVGKITMTMVTDANANFSAYRNNGLDMVEISASNVKQVLAGPNWANQVVRLPELVTVAYLFNTSKTPFDNHKVRLAFSKAINRQAFVDKVGLGLGKPAYSWVPPGMLGHDPNLGKDVQAYDQAAAARLLTQAGYSDVKKLAPVSFTYPNNSTGRTMAEFFQGQIRDGLGIEVKLEPTEPASFRNSLISGRFQVTAFTWGADYPDLDDWLGQFASQASFNHTLYSSSRFDQLIDKAAVEGNLPMRLQLLLEAQRILAEEAPIIPLMHRERLWLVKPNISGLTTTAQDVILGESSFRDIRIGP